MNNAVLQIAMRYIHIVSAIILVGGMAFMLFCSLPVAKTLEESQRGLLLAGLQRRFTRVMWFCIVGLLVSGIFNWILLNPAYHRIGAEAGALIGTKVLLALIIFAIVWAQSAGYIKADNPRRVLMINIHLAAVVILLAAILRYLRLDEYDRIVRDIQRPAQDLLNAIGVH